ncbi:MAG: LamG domain-containing protein [Pyrinomonadaceae bacterium]
MGIPLQLPQRCSVDPSEGRQRRQHAVSHRCGRWEYHRGCTLQHRRFCRGTGGVVVLNQWTHVACTYDRQFVRLYVNGVEVAAQAATQPIPALSHELWIGNHERFIRQFDGLIDEVEIFNRALSAAEIQDIVKAGSAGKCKLQLTSLSPATFWIGLKNSDDQGTQFDLRTEVYINDTLVAEGETRCITGVTRNPSKAKEVSVEFGPISDGGFASGDGLALRVLTRIGTNPDDTKCSGPGGSHNNAVGLR